MKKLLGVFLLLSVNLFGGNFYDYDSYQGKLSLEDVEKRIKTYLENDPSLRKFYRLTPEALYIGDLDHLQIDYILRLNTNLPIQSCEHIKKRDLKSVKIAIDPGHFGGEFGDLEERFVAISASQTKNNQPIRFQEGDLTYLTALELKRLLESEGATVLMTREELGKGVIKESFFEWLEKHTDLKSKDSSMSQVFRTYYNREDLIARAQKINEFSPDFTIIIHYNAHLTDEEKNRRIPFSQTNFNLAFVPGAFGAKELADVKDRCEFLRLIVTDDLDKSVKLSECVVAQFANTLRVPLHSPAEKTSYASSVCLFQKPGIYCRNLTLTRLVHGPLCYGETLIQNNEEEVYRLSALDAVIAGIPCSKRIEEVAQAYFEGIKDYVKTY